MCVMVAVLNIYHLHIVNIVFVLFQDVSWLDEKEKLNISIKSLKEKVSEHSLIICNHTLCM